MADKLNLSMAAINNAPSPRDLLELPAVQENWVRTYNLVSGKEDGEMRFEAEKILYLRAIQANKALQDCDKFSHYAAFTELAISGLSLRDGLAYIIAYGKTASFMPGWKGRLEQITEIRNVVHVHEPQVVFDNDEFDFEKGMEVIIHKHKPAKTRTKENFITHVYLVIQYTHGLKVYIMDRQEVLNIRDKYSSSYKAYVKAFNEAKKANQELQWGDTWMQTFHRKDGSGSWQKEIELPMWVSDEIQAFKKTIVKRAYQMQEKTPKMKYLDSRMQELPPEITNEVEETGKTDFNKPEDYSQFTEVDDGAGGIDEPGAAAAANPIITELIKQEQPKAKPVKQDPVKATVIQPKAEPAKTTQSTPPAQGNVFENPDEGF